MVGTGTGIWIPATPVVPDVGDVGVGAGNAELGVHIVPVVVVAVDVGVGAEPAVPASVVMMDVSGAHNFKNAFAGVMVAVDNLGVDEPIEFWLAMRDKVIVDGLLDCVASCGCVWVTGGCGGGSWG
jgi:hypothetical protein